MTRGRAFRTIDLKVPARDHIPPEHSLDVSLRQYIADKFALIIHCIDDQTGFVGSDQDFIILEQNRGLFIDIRQQIRRH
jgi:hypothetical protein